MKKTIILSIVFCALFAYMPFAAQAAGIISAVDVTLGEEDAVAGENASYSFEMTLTSPVANGSTIALLLVDEEDDVVDSFDISSASFSSKSDFNGTLTTDGPANIYILLQEDISGTVNFNIDSITNTDTAGTYMFNVGIGADFKTATDIIASSTFDITAATTPNAVESIDFQVASTYTGTSNTAGVTMVNNRVIAQGEDLYLFFTGENITPDDSGFDFSSAEFSNAAENLDEQFTCGAESGAEYIIKCTVATATLAVDTAGYDIIIDGFTNSDTEAEYYLNALVGTPSQDADYVLAANTLTLTELTAPTKIKKKYLKTKKIKKKSAIMKTTKAKSIATFYKYRIEKKKKGKKGYKIKKTYKNVTALKKKAKNLKRKTKYRWKAKACNDAGCSNWSKYKKFNTK